ncbi:MAG: MFS transporter [Phycisphaeraceae bacterium]
MDPLRRQYFFAFAILGSVLPYLPVWLEGRGLSEREVGYVLATTGVGVMISPLLLTLLADTRVQPRRLLAVQMLGTAGAACLMLVSQGFVPLLLSYLLFALAMTPVMPLQDSLLFSRQQQEERNGTNATPYHKVRVFGTVGFLVPAVALFTHLQLDGSLDWALILTAVFGVLGAINTRFMPERQRPAQASEPKGAARQIPTLDALCSVMRSDALVFALAMWLLYMSMSAYYTFYPILITRSPESFGAGIDAKWIGLIANVGVMVEVPFMLAFGWLLAKLGLRWFMTLGAAAMALRMGLLWLVPTASVAVGTQALHGMMVLVLHVAPPVFFNRFATERYRSSIQGLYAVAIMGTGRIVGNVTAGEVADVSLRGAFLYATLMAVAAAALFALAFRPRGEAASVRA